jgi:hypothetical protein
MASVPAQANDMNEMRAELENLLDRMERIEQAQPQQQVAETSAIRTNRTYIRKRAPQMQDHYRPYDVRDLYIMPETARANGVVGGDLPGSFKLPGSDTSVSISGWLTMGVNYDGGTSEGAFSTMGHAGTIQIGENHPQGGSDQFNMESLSNGLAIGSSSETDMGTVSTNILLITDAAAPILVDTLSIGGVRTAGMSMSMGNWTFGHQGFAYSSGACYGETVETGGAPCPIGAGPAIQYAGGGGGMDYRIQLVTPKSTIDAGTMDAVGGVNISGGIPDLQARISRPIGPLNFSVGMQLRQFGYDNNQDTTIAGAADTSVGWGIFPEVQLPLGNNTLYAGLSYGDGARNNNINHALWTGGRGDQATVDTTTGSIINTTTVSLHTHYTHWWNDSARSTLLLQGGNSNPDDAATGDEGFPGTGTTAPMTKWRTISGNVVWSVAPRVTMGVSGVYNSALFRGDNTNTNNAEDNANEALEAHYRVTVSY